MAGLSGVKINFRMKDIPVEVAEEVILRTAEKSAMYAKVYVAKDTGTLEQSITPVHNGLTGAIYSIVDYAVEQEYGNPANPKKFTPYMRPAAQVAGSQAEVDKSMAAAFARVTKQ
jgi:copper oxidase (laccase) domain-containing protein